MYVDTGKIEPLWSSRAKETGRRLEIHFLARRNRVVHIGLNFSNVSSWISSKKHWNEMCERLFFLLCTYLDDKLHRKLSRFSCCGYWRIFVEWRWHQRSKGTIHCSCFKRKIDLSTHLPINQSIHPCIHPCMHACIRPSVHPSIHPSIQLTKLISFAAEWTN